MMLRALSIVFGAVPFLFALIRAVAGWLHMRARRQTR
jgi:hypothetical protein